MRRAMRRPLYTKALGCGLGLAWALAARCDVAKAGHWEIESVVADGKTTYPAAGDYGPNDGGPVEGSVRDRWQGFQNSADTGHVSKGSSYQDASTTKPGVTMQMKDVGSAKVIFVWETQDGHGHSDHSEPDEWVFAKVTIEASAYAGSFWSSTGTEEYNGRPGVPGDGANPQSSVSVSASNGFETALPMDATNLMSPDGQGRGRAISITTTRVLMQASGGQDHVTMELPGASAIATATGGPRWGQAQVGSYAGYSIQTDYRGVFISSSIETSYYKVQGDAPPDLPESRFRSSTPKSGPGPWAISHERNRNGSMDVTSALDYGDYGLPAGSPHWHGGTWLAANEPGFQQPERTWALSPGTHVSTPDATGNSIGISVSSTGPKNGVGVEEPLSGITLSTVDVSEPEASRPHLTNTYGINWKLPVQFDKDLPLPAGTQLFTYQFNSMGPFNEPVEADETFPSVIFSYDPYYIQFASLLTEMLPEFGEVAIHWQESGSAKLAIILAKTFAPAHDFNTNTHSCSHNSENMFNQAQGMANRPDDILGQLPASYQPLAPPGVSFNRCKLAEVLHYGVYEHKLKQFDEYDYNGYVGPKGVKSDTWVEGGFTGRYVRANEPGAE